MLSIILYCFAFVLFVLAGFSVPSGRYNLLGFGFACLTAAAIFDHHAILSGV